MAHKPETTTAVRGSYVHERLPLAVAAIKHGVSYSTAQSWKKAALAKGDDWNKARSAALMAAGGLGDSTNRILEGFFLLFETTIDQVSLSGGCPIEKTEAISRLSDAYAKMVKSAGATNQPVAKLAVAMEVLNELAKFIKEEFPDDIERFVRILERFGDRVSALF